MSRPLVCRLRLADGDDTTMSGEDMRRAAHQLRCKDTEFLRHLHVLAQVFFSSLTPVPLSKGEGSEMQDKQSLEHIEEFVTIERKISGTIFLKNLRTREYFRRQKAKKYYQTKAASCLYTPILINSQ